MVLSVRISVRLLHLAPDWQELSLPASMGLGVDLVQLGGSWLHTLGRERQWSVCVGGVGAPNSPRILVSDVHFLLWTVLFSLRTVNSCPAWLALSYTWCLYSPGSWSGLRDLRFAALFGWYLTMGAEFREPLCQNQPFPWIFWPWSGAWVWSWLSSLHGEPLWGLLCSFQPDT